jgi:hypothetical protein
MLRGACAFGNLTMRRSVVDVRRIGIEHKQASNQLVEHIEIEKDRILVTGSNRFQPSQHSRTAARIRDDLRDWQVLDVPHKRQVRLRPDPIIAWRARVLDVWRIRREERSTSE